MCNLKILRRGKPDIYTVDWHALFTGGIQSDCRGSQRHLEQSEGVLAAVGHVEEAVLVLVLLINGRHQGSCRWKSVLHKDEDRLLSAELDPLSDNVHELSNCKVRGDEVLFLVNVRNITLPSLLNDHRNSVRVLLPYAGSLRLPPLCNAVNSKILF